MALRDDLIDDGSVDWAVHVVQQQCACVAITESADVQRGQAGQHAVSDAGARRAHQRDPLGEQAARHEGEHLRGSAVQPLRVIDDASQRLLLGGLRHQRQRGESHQEPVGCGTSAHPEHGRERVALRGWQLVEMVQQRSTELMQAAIGQVHFRLHPCGRHDPPLTAPSRLTGYPT